MKKMNFLAKLKGEGKLKAVEPSEEVKEAYLTKSESNLSSAKLLLENDKLEESVYLAYYSMYNSLLALLFRVGIKSENHSASIILLRKVFDIDNPDISFAKRERVDKQYYVDFHVTKEDVEELIEKAEDFNKWLLDFLSKLTNERIKLYQEQFKKLTG
ncbi:HEPN domain-containing protein [Candidatus Woesearchaeota archaeon]|nr:HEPN domain-containing protein [Candidatus Woesearchaeota archaeon]